jgi:small subunit ribosomal protein S20
MPVSKAAKKALRQNVVRTKKNTIAKAEIDTLKKNLKKAIELGNQSKAKEIWLKLHKKLDKAAKINLIKSNTVDRIKSRLSKKIEQKFSKK